MIVGDLLLFVFGQMGINTKLNVNNMHVLRLNITV